MMFPERMHFMFFNSEEIIAQCFSLLRVLFTEKKENCFVCFTEVDDTLSLLVDHHTFDLFATKPESTQWRQFQICDTFSSANGKYYNQKFMIGLLTIHTALPGIVASISKNLCWLKGRVLSISSFSTDFIMV